MPALRVARVLASSRPLVGAPAQVASAVAALKKHLAKEAAAKNGLFEDDDMFNLVRACAEPPRASAGRIPEGEALPASAGPRRALRALTRRPTRQVVALKKTPQEAKPKPYRMCVVAHVRLRRLRCAVRSVPPLRARQRMNFCGFPFISRSRRCLTIRF